MSSGIRKISFNPSGDYVVALFLLATVSGGGVGKVAPEPVSFPLESDFLVSPVHSHLYIYTVTCKHSHWYME